MISIKLSGKILLPLYFVFYSMHAFPAWPESESDFSLLPPYCKARGEDAHGQIYSTWSKRIGNPFLDIHHYCAGLHTVRLANQTTEPIQKKYHLQQAVAEMEYVIRASVKRSGREPIISEIYTQQGKVLLRLDRIPEALNAFQKAIQIKKDYAPAYIAMADLYISQGNDQEALDVVNRGLKYAPKSKGLKRRLDKLS